MLRTEGFVGRLSYLILATVVTDACPCAALANHLTWIEAGTRIKMWFDGRHRRGYNV